jgi:hypothetical protein
LNMMFFLFHFKEYQMDTMLLKWSMEWLKPIPKTVGVWVKKNQIQVRQ